MKVGPVPNDSRRADHAAVLRVQRAPRHAARRSSTSRRPTGARRSSGSPSTPTWSSRASGPASSTASASATRRRRRRNPRIVYCSTSGYGQTGPRSQWAGHDLNYLGRRRLPRLHRAATPTGEPADPGRDRRRQRRRRHARGDGDPRRARAPRHHRRGRVPRRVGRRRRARAHGARRSTSTSPPARCPGPATASSPAATPATTSTRTRDGRGSRSAAIEPRFWANLCRAARPRAVGRAPDRRRGAGRDPRRPRAPRSLTPRPRRLGRRARRRPTRASPPVLTVPEVVDDEQFLARDDVRRRDARRARRRSARSARCSRAWTARQPDPYEARDATVTDTDELLRAAGLTARRARRRCARQE